jgi:hypothetical protein
MVDWLVIAADCTNAGRGVSGNTLFRFLRTYFGRRSVQLRKPDQYRRNPVACDTLCLGLPTSLEPDELSRFQCRRLIVFDYLDSPQLQWTVEQAAAICDRTSAYLKPWREVVWNYDVRMGLLPIRRYGRLAAAIAVQRTRLALLRRPPLKVHDVAFAGRPNSVKLFQLGEVVPSEQRVEWLLALRQQAPELRLWGGLVRIADNPARQRQLCEQFGDVSHLEHRAAKVGFLEYYYHLCHSRVALTPGGNVPWTYRHYEALYSGAVVVTIDFRQREMLVPFPNDGMIHVPDGESVVPAVREALDWSRERPELPRQNFLHLERYLRWGMYSRRRPELMQRFLAELD